MDIIWNINEIDLVDSTNKLLAQKLAENPNLKEGYAVRANFQSQGLGQRNNHWESEPDKNLLCSFILKPGLPVDRQFLLSQVISLAVAEYLIDKEKIIESIKIKWPNDIYIGNKKVAGILIQNILQGKQIKNSIIGIGLNLNQEVFLSNAPNPVSLKQITKMDYDIHLECIKLLDKVDKYYDELFKIRKAKPQNMYRFLLFRLNEEHQFLNNEGLEFSGKIKGVDDQGCLLIETNNGIKHFNFQQLKYII